MIRYYVYDNTSGVISTIGAGHPAPVSKDDYSTDALYQAALATAKSNFLTAVAKSGYTAAEGVVDPKTQKVNVSDGTLVSYTPADTTDWGKKNRKIRDILLRNSDWTQLPDSPLESSKKTAWATYRQDLRDLPDDVSTFETETLTDSDLPTEPS